RERRDDIPILAQHFVGRFNQRNGTRRVLTQGALQKTVAHDFPGNVRELENVVEQAAALSHSDEITADDVRLEALAPDAGPPAVRPADAAAALRADSLRAPMFYETEVRASGGFADHDGAAQVAGGAGVGIAVIRIVTPAATAMASSWTALRAGTAARLAVSSG